MKATLSIVPAVLVLSLPQLAAQEQWSTTNTRAQVPGVEPPRAVVSDVAWISGYWEGEALGGRVEEIWSPPSAGGMVGMFRLLGEDGVSFYELLTLTEEGESVVLRLKHFAPDLTGWEEKDEVQTFPLVELTDDAAYFAGLTFRRSGPDRMDVFVANEGPGGRTTELVFEYGRREGPIEGPARAQDGADGPAGRRAADGQVISKVTPVLHVESIEPCLVVWRERLGFALVDSVAVDGRMIFAMLGEGPVEVMYQTRDVLAADAPALASLTWGSSFLFLEVAEIDAIDAALSGIEHAVPRKTTDYGAEEITVLDGCGNVITFAEFS